MAPIAGLLAACGGAPTPTLSDDLHSSGEGGKSGTFGGSSDGGTTTSTTNPTASCATSTLAAKFSPINLVFMIDRSGSMGDTPEKRTLKWDPVIGALKGFFEDSGAAGVKAALQFFPQGDPDDDEYCKVSTYRAPTVQLTDLPNANISTLLDAIQPDADGTPAAPALRGALEHATQKLTETQLPTAVVFVTDGAPNKCNSTPEAVAKIAGAFANQVPTYVIGVGSVETLDLIASSGSTGKALVVNVADPSATRTQFLAALQKIRGSTLPCEIALPAPPDGSELDYAKVNLTLQNGGKTTDLSTSKDCADGGGWRYDDPTKPTKITLCPQSCDLARAGSQLSVTLGCATRETK